MKSFQRSAIFGVLLVCSGATLAESASLNEFQPKVMPVLVQVNSHGKVTDVSPAIALSPRINRLLRANLDEMISKPAVDKHGHPMSSQFIINLALQASPLDNGNYDARFSYVSTASVPAGSWYWVHVDGHRVALARQGSSYRQQRIPPPQQLRESNYQRSYQPAPTSPTNNAVNNASAQPRPVQGR